MAILMNIKRQTGPKRKKLKISITVGFTKARNFLICLRNFAKNCAISLHVT